MREQIQKWCDENNHVLLDIKRHEIEVDVVVRIAQEATQTNDITARVRDQEVAFARFLVMSYLDDKLATNIIAKRLGVTHDMITYARNMRILTGDTKYFKPWQQVAIKYFKSKISEAEKHLNK